MGGENKEEEQPAAAAAAAPAAMGGRAAAAAARERSSFAVTCSLLSQYLKEKKGGLPQGLGGLAMPPPASPAAGVSRPPTTMNLLSALDAPAEETKDDAAKFSTEVPKPTHHDQQNGENPREAAGEEAQQLTIFYGGKVVVFDNFPSTKVKDLLQVVSPPGDGVDRAGGSAAPQDRPRPSQTSLSDMPIARRNSLHRFLEKRKGRIIAKAPYQANNSPADASKQAAGDKKSWLGLGQELMTVKQEI